MESVAKVYDRILCRRLESWFKPDREQAGAQKGRSCTEWIVTLRLLIDYALYKKVKLFILFVDFSKAYDRVPRSGLISALKTLGCGIVMLCAIAVMYSNTQFVLGAAIISVTLGVKQGSPSSCFLFTMYVNPLIRNLKEKCGLDGFLGNLHSLLLMDDTVIFATSRERLIEKIEVLEQFCSTSGMVINETKTEFMVINGNEADKQNLVRESMVIKPCEFYVYLGAVFCASGRILPALEKHCEDKFANILKYVAFVDKNSTFHFSVKRLVMEAALLTSIFYSCEAWLAENLKPVNTMYMYVIKTLLGVRRTTANDLCLTELGLPSAKAYVGNIQKRFFERTLESRRNTPEDPFMFVYQLCQQAKTPCAKYVNALLQKGDIIEDDIREIKLRVRESNGSKFVTYRELNPDLDVCAIYTDNRVNELNRIKVSQLRLSSHNLAIETGRWSRIPRDRRLCSCGEVQTELHVICYCTLTEPCRRNKDVDTSGLSEFFRSDPRSVCSVSSDSLAIFG